MKPKPVYEFEVGIPSHQYWVYRVKATSLKSAVAKIRSCSLEAHEVYQVPCPKGRTKPVLIQKVKV